MDILFNNSKLEKTFNDQKRLIRTYGTIRSKMIRRRLDEFRAAETLAVIAKLPSARCHEYSGEKVGMLAVDLDHPYRLIFQPADDPIPLKEDGGLDWSKVKTIMILEVKDPHR